MQWGEKRPAPYGTQAPASRPQGCQEHAVNFLTSLRGERDPNTMRYEERTQQRLVPLASLSVGSGPRRGLDRPFEMVWRELPKWDCAVEAHFKRGERR